MSLGVTLYSSTIVFLLFPLEVQTVLQCGVSKFRPVSLNDWRHDE